MKSIFITGAASGIGLATARHFAKKGWLVGLFDVNEAGVADLLESGEFPNACGGRCDVTSRDSISAALEKFSGATEGRMEVLVNNAGVLWSGPVEEIDVAHTHAMIDVNVKGLTDVALQAFPLLRDTPGSYMVNLCSLSSVYGVPSLAIYSATKFFVRGFTEALNVEWKKHDIHVVSIKPPYIQTAMLENVADSMMQKIKPDFGPGAVAETIDRAVQGKRVSLFMGTRSHVMNIAFRLLPEVISSRLMRWVMAAN